MLFLFDDKLMIVKRPGNGEKSGPVLVGLDQLEKNVKGSGVPSGLKKSGMGCKGVVDLTDVGGAGMSSHLSIATLDFHVYLEKPPQDQTDKWSGCPFIPLSGCFRLTRPISTHNKQRPTKSVFWRTSGSPKRTFVRGLVNR